MLNLIYPPRHYFFDSGGKPLIGGYIEYDGLIYQDVFKTVPHQKRILLDEHGSALLYFDDDININIYNRHGDFIETQIIPAQPEWVFFYDKFGKPLKNGKVWVYRFRSTILKNSFNIADKSVLNANPVILDDDGKAKIYIDGAYRLKVYNADDVLIADEDVYALPTPIEHQYILTSRIYPQFKPQDLILTSRKYPHWVEQSLVLTSLNYPYIDEVLLQVGVKPVDIVDIQRPIEVLNIKGVTPLDIVSRQIVKRHNQPNEDILTVSFRPLDIVSRQIVKRHNQPNEDILTVGFKPLDISAKTMVIRHHQPLEDVLTVGFQPLDIIVN